MARINSRAKGRRAENELAKILARIWPDCKRNLDQFGLDKRDLLDTPGYHWQIKRVEKLNIWAALNQTEEEAEEGQRPRLAFRRNNSKWYVAMPLEDYLANHLEKLEDPGAQELR